MLTPEATASVPPSKRVYVRLLPLTGAVDVVCAWCHFRTLIGKGSVNLSPKAFFCVTEPHPAGPA